jgi:hypothetical protein
MNPTSACQVFLQMTAHFERTVAEAIRMSPFVYESFLEDPSVSTFSISSSQIDSNDFIEFVQMFRSNNFCFITPLNFLCLRE